MNHVTDAESTRPDQHHQVTIIVNGRERRVHKGEISYEEVVNLAYDSNPPQGPNVVITVTYTRGPHGQHQGTLLPGGTVKVHDGMVFNVTATDKS